jgi:hypothetical protein
MWGGLEMQLKTWWPGKITIAFSILGVLVAVGIFFALPTRYVSQSTLFVERTTLASGRESTSLTENTAIHDLVFDRDALALIIRRWNIYPSDRDRLSEDGLIDKMSRNIRVIAAPSNSAASQDRFQFDIQFVCSDPYLARQVNVELMSLLLHENLHPSTFVFRVLNPPSVVRLPEGPRLLRFGCIGLLAGILTVLLATGVIRLRHFANARGNS